MQVGVDQFLDSLVFGGEPIFQEASQPRKGPEVGVEGSHEVCACSVDQH